MGGGVWGVNVARRLGPHTPLPNPSPEGRGFSPPHIGNRYKRQHLGKLYVGVASNLIRRLAQHRDNGLSGFTAQYNG